MKKNLLSRTDDLTKVHPAILFLLLSVLSVLFFAILQIKKTLLHNTTASFNVILRKSRKKTIPMIYLSVITDSYLRINSCQAAVYGLLL